MKAAGAAAAGAPAAQENFLAEKEEEKEEEKEDVINFLGIYSDADLRFEIVDEEHLAPNRLLFKFPALR